MVMWSREGLQVFMNGEPFGSVKADEGQAEAYLVRVRERYPNGLPFVTREDRQKGGPWRYRYPQGGSIEEGIIFERNLADAKSVLRYNLGLKSLPDGIEWELAQEYDPVPTFRQRIRRAGRKGTRI